MQIEQSTMANMLRRMERDGLIARVPDSADGRRFLVMLTERARELEGELVSAARAVNAVATIGLDEDEASAFLSTLATVIANLDTRGAYPDQAYRQEPPR